jgi:imidazolonepropionase-like amidohydrolase
MAQDSLILTNARVLDGRGGTRERADVVLSDGRIQEVREAAGSQAELAGVLDLQGKTLMPGLIDAHAHLYSHDPIRPLLRGEPPRPRELSYLVAARTVRAYLEAGITTMRDVGSLDLHGVVLREAVRHELCPGPRILTCGYIISATSPGGAIYHAMYRQADGPEEMRKAVREQLRHGADYIKVMTTGARSVLLEHPPEPAQITREELDTIVGEAHRMGYRVAAHVEGIGGARPAVEAGVDTVEHGLSLHREPELLERMAGQGAVLVPTLTTFHDIAEHWAERHPEPLVEQAKRQKEEAYGTLVAARDAGVTLAMGFDSGPPGDSALELVRMVDGGLTAMEGIVAATSGSAAACGLADVGAIAPGFAADLLVVDGDPLEDVRVLVRGEGVWLVLQAGRPVAGNALARPPLVRAASDEAGHGSETGGTHGADD